MNELQQYPNLQEVVGKVIEVWPAHASYARRSFENRSPEVLKTTDSIAGLVKALAKEIPGGLEQLCSDYQFMCEKLILPEELYFRRHGKYRLSTQADAEREVYSNAPYMQRYVNGIVISHVMWSNHSSAFDSYVSRFLQSLPQDSDHLEIGPGHGLLLYFAAANPKIKTVTGWDVSPTSIESTKRTLSSLGVTRPVPLVLQNLFEQPSDGTKQYDSIVLSEVLEHVEQPVAALRAIKGWLKPGGRVWVNVPANSPAPDHLFLVHSLEHACELVAEAGLDIEHSIAFPMTGVTLEKANRQKLTISCIVTGQRPLGAA
jgi:2-polyprenyl-3-methyl-5-hydroxy-6-metoxy-1,4-benzoquinol methylase